VLVETLEDVSPSELIAALFELEMTGVWQNSFHGGTLLKCGRQFWLTGLGVF
jgi:hypothetical protein